MAADSVGVAMPATMVPSTAAIRITGASRSSSSRMRLAPKLPADSISAGGILWGWKIAIAAM